MKKDTSSNQEWEIGRERISSDTVFLVEKLLESREYRHGVRAQVLKQGRINKPELVVQLGPVIRLGIYVLGGISPALHAGTQEIRMVSMKILVNS
jgi:hypothetical protein